MADTADLLARIEALESLLNASSASGSLLNAGDNSWMLISTALVYVMTPGLAFFYGGMVQSKNLLGTFSLSFLCMGIVTVQWILFGYSLVFGPRGGAAQIGGGDASWYALDFGFITDPFYDPTYPLYTHATFQCAFAVITPALISGVVVNKMKPVAFCIFVLVWTTVVYDVIAFWVWNPVGWLHEYGALDFAGGTVIHISSGFSALICSLFLRDKSAAHTHEAASQNLPMTVLGGGLLWFGWMGFNAGSASSAGDIASIALINTNASAASSLLTFVALERLVEGKSSVVGGISGAIVGLVIITPAAGFVRPGWALLMGIWGTVLVYAGIWIKRKWTKLDDPLDVFLCHGMGGVYGSLLTGLFCEKAVNSAGFDGAFYGNGRQFWDQIAAVLVVIVYACVLTALICLVLDKTIGLRVSKLEAQLGMDNILVTAPSAHDTNAAYTEQAINKVRQALAGHSTSFTAQEEAQLQHIFSLIDDHHTGQITLPKFVAALRMMNIILPKEEAALLFSRFDSDASGTIEFEEFRQSLIQANRESQLNLKHEIELMATVDTRPSDAPSDFRPSDARPSDAPPSSAQARRGSATSEPLVTGNLRASTARRLSQ
jgi:Amt family ammonium transporter